MTTRIMSWNVNGLDPRARDDGLDMNEFLARHMLDIGCLQETHLSDNTFHNGKAYNLAGRVQVARLWRCFFARLTFERRKHKQRVQGFDVFFANCTQKKGIYGVATYVKKGLLAAKPIVGFGMPEDEEAREFDDTWVVVVVVVVVVVFVVVVVSFFLHSINNII